MRPQNLDPLFAVKNDLIFGASFEIDSLFEKALMTCHFDRKIVLVSAV